MYTLLFGSNHRIRSYLLSLLGVFLAQCGYPAFAASDYIPPQAFTYRDTIQRELSRYFQDIPNYNYIPALIEHESCISLTNRRCWSSTSELRTKREQGVGLGMLTRAFNADGSVRFDTLKDLRNKYLSDLKDANWSSFKYRPDLQVRAITLLVRDNYKTLIKVPDPIHRLQMTDVAYNGGVGWVLKERRACGLAKACDPNIWFGHVERYCLRAKGRLYGNRSVCDISRHHPDDVFHNRLPKYNAKYFSNKSPIN